MSRIISWVALATPVGRRPSQAPRLETLPRLLGQRNVRRGAASTMPILSANVKRRFRL